MCIEIEVWFRWVDFELDNVFNFIWIENIGIVVVGVDKMMVVFDY